MATDSGVQKLGSMLEVVLCITHRLLYVTTIYTIQLSDVCFPTASLHNANIFEND